MSVHPHAEPFVADGRSRRRRTDASACCSATASPGSPASMRPWAEHLAAQGYAVSVPRLPGHGTTWQELNKTTWADWYGEVERAFDGAGRPGRHRRRLRPVDGRRPGAPARRRPPRRVAGLVLVNPAVSTERKDVKLLPVLKHVIPSFPGIANDIKKPGVEEHGYTKTPLRAAHSMFQAYKALRADLAGSPPAPAASAPPRTTSSTRRARRAIQAAVSSTDVTEQMLENSYHVATLDNDAEQIFEDSRAFVERVTGATDLRGLTRSMSPHDPDDESPGATTSACPPRTRPGARSSTTTATGREIAGRARGRRRRRRPRRRLRRRGARSQPRAASTPEDHFVPPPPPPLPLPEPAAAARLAGPVRRADARAASRWWPGWTCRPGWV